ncbi:hypothetical protein AC578_5401 [Pseudocercospora eumusae]|uniref:Carbohydrate-binding module family 19 domain-containing protein n=1 Tax=Pseudocercospora eumusae TaxID=321146 RepID=A0A139HK54_9PEZI|nr:hypothetical protein AC578_5401 [Pseudocercospora eumusae]
MFSKTATLGLAALAFCGTSTAHMIMASPVPYGADSLNNSPLSQAAEYPCKQRSGVYDISKMNNMAVGENQTLSFTGSATHGGGTCQLAVSLDTKPTKDSVFKIIQVYEGGCPSAVDGNAGHGSNLQFSIPENFPNGQAALAWVWYNKIGNRELYMNCAPITVTGGSENKDFFNTLPNLYLVNSPVDDTCTVPDSKDVVIPVPGKFVQSLGTATATATGAGCAAAAAAQTKGVSGGAPGYGSGSGSSSMPASSSAQPTSAAGYGATGSSSASAPAYSSASSSAAAPAYTESPSSAAPPSYGPFSSPAFPQTTPAAGEGIYGPASTAASAAAPAGTGLTACSQDGFVCHGTKQFGQCANGQLVGGWRDMAAGTECQNNAIVKVKRDDMRHVHVRRHVQNSVHRHAA